MEAVVKYKPINSATGKIGSSSLAKKQKKNKKYLSLLLTHQKHHRNIMNLMIKK